MVEVHVNDARMLPRINPVPSPTATSEKSLAEIQKMRVLVIDDNYFARALLRNVLQALGVWGVVECNSAPDGMDRLVEDSFDLVLVDNNMPKMTGTEFTRAVRRSAKVKDPAVPIIMVSSHTDIKHIKEAVEAGIHDFLAKPFSAVSLARRLYACLTTERPFVREDTYVGPCRRISKRKPRPGLQEQRNQWQ